MAAVIKTEETFAKLKVSSVLCGVNNPNKGHLDLITAARELLMRIGIRSVSMDDIAREVGISKKTLYQTVDNKEELIRMVLQSGTEEDHCFLEDCTTNAADAIEEMLTISRYYIRRMRQVSPTTLHDLRKYYPELFHSKIEGHQQHFLRRVESNLKRGIAEGLYRPEIDSAIIANLHVGMTMMVVDRGIFPAQERPLSDILLQHSTYHLNGIVNQAGRERLQEYLKLEDLP